MVKAGVDPGYIFKREQRMTVEMEDVESKLSFMTHLLPNLRPGCDMYVCMPPIKNAESPSAEPDWGTTKGGAFSLAFRYLDGQIGEELPLPGLVHNVDQGMSAKPTEKEVAEGRPANQNYIPVDEDFYLYTNVNITSRPNIAGVQFDWNNSLRSSELDEEAKKAVMQEYKTAERMKPNWVSYKNALLTFQANQSNTIGDVLEQTVHSMKLPFLYKQDQIGSSTLKIDACIINLKDQKLPDDAVSLVCENLTQSSIDYEIKNDLGTYGGRSLASYGRARLQEDDEEDTPAAAWPFHKKTTQTCKRMTGPPFTGLLIPPILGMTGLPDTGLWEWLTSL